MLITSATTRINCSANHSLSMGRLRSITALGFLAFLNLWPLMCLGIPSFPGSGESGAKILQFSKAPEYRNRGECPGPSGGESWFGWSCDPSLVHIAMALDSEYLRGSVAAIHSVLCHSSCPENVFFHFVAAEFDTLSTRVLTRIFRSTFPSLKFKVYVFREDAVINLISSSTQQAWENPLNYARN